MSKRGVCSAKRQGLAKYNGKLATFTATTDVCIVNYNPYGNFYYGSRLLTNICDENEFISDHVWVMANNMPEWVEEGMRIQFTAVARPYKRMRSGHSVNELGLEDVAEVCLAVDYE